MFSHVDAIRQIQTSFSSRSYSTPFPETQPHSMERIGTKDGHEKCQTFAMCHERRDIGTETCDRQMDQGEELSLFSLRRPRTPPTPSFNAIRLHRTHYLTHFSYPLLSLNQVLVEENLDLNEHSKIAENHFVMAMAKKHFIAWNNVLRQRGKMNRMREKLFYVWAKWAQRERRLKMMREDLEEWLRTRLKRRTVDAMFDIGYKVISKRITKLRRLKEVAQDRRVVICAYALMHCDDHVMMVIHTLVSISVPMPPLPAFLPLFPPPSPTSF